MAPVTLPQQRTSSNQSGRDRLTKIINNGPPWEYWSNPEGWAAYIDSNMWGVGVYNKNATLFIGGFHDTIGGDSNDNSTGYISPLDNRPPIRY